MKKYFSLISLLLLACSLSSCSSGDVEENVQSEVTPPMFINDIFDYNKPRDYPYFPVEKYIPRANSLFETTSSERINEVYAKGTDIKDKYDKQLTNALPSTGNVRLCIVPFLFKGRGINPKRYNEAAYLRSINDFYFGKYEKFKSVAQYYNENSFGKLKLDGFVTNICQTKYTKDQFFDLSRQKNGLKKVVQEMFDINFGGTNPRLNISQFDGNNDNILDGLVLIPMDEEYKFVGHGTFKSNIPYAFNSLEYMIEESDYFPREYFANIAYMLGLHNNVYEGKNNYSYSRDYISSTIGVHNCSTAYNMGWTIPTVIDSAKGFSKQTITLNAFQNDGSSIILGTNFNGTCFDEYYMLEYVNDCKLNTFFNAGYDPDKLGSNNNVYLYHIDQRLGYFNFDPNFGYKWDGAFADYMEANEGYYQVLASDVNPREADETTLNYSGFHRFTVANTLHDGYEIEGAIKGNVFNSDELPLRFNDGTRLPFKITINNLTKDSANITIINQY